MLHDSNNAENHPPSHRGPTASRPGLFVLEEMVSSHLCGTIHCFEVEAASDQLKRVLRAAVLRWEIRKGIFNMRLGGVAREESNFGRSRSS
jgi:hypothetical protein